MITRLVANKQFQLFARIICPITFVRALYQTSGGVLLSTPLSVSFHFLQFQRQAGADDTGWQGKHTEAEQNEYR